MHPLDLSPFERCQTQWLSLMQTTRNYLLCNYGLVGGVGNAWSISNRTGLPTFARGVAKLASRALDSFHNCLDPHPALVSFDKRRGYATASRPRFINEMSRVSAFLRGLQVPLLADQGQPSNRPQGDRVHRWIAQVPNHRPMRNPRFRTGNDGVRFAGLPARRRLPCHPPRCDGDAASSPRSILRTRSTS